MKKTSKLVILALLVVGAVMTLCACGLVAGAQAIEIVNPPKQDYVTTDTDFDWTGFQIKVIYGENNSKTFTYEDLKKEAETNNQTLTISAFDNSEGKHTAIITYMGVSVAFEYTVNAGLFAGGDGTEANPYQIATAEQFLRLAGDQKGNYFVLINDIDFNGNLVEGVDASNFTFDGNGYALEGINTELFGTVTNATVTNFDLHIEEQGHIMYYAYDGIVEISDINVYGVYNNTEEIGTNDGIVINFTAAETLKLKNINVYADFITYAKYASPFIGGYINGSNMIAEFTNCKFYGTAQAFNLGVFKGNTTHDTDEGTKVVVDSISGNYGTFIASTVTYFGYVNMDSNQEAARAGEAGKFGYVASANAYGIVKPFTAVKIANDSSFTFDAIEGAVSYRVFVSVSTTAYFDEELTNKAGSGTQTAYDSNDYENVIKVENGKGTVSNLTNLQKWKLVETATDITKYEVNNALAGGWYLKTGSVATTYIVYALDADGNVIGFGAIVK